MGPPKGQEEALAASKEATAIAKEEQARKTAIFEQIKPFATQLMALGIDPQAFLASPLGQSILGMGRQGISQEFQGARQNLFEGLGASGLYGSGVGVGPMANLFGQEAMQQANLIQQLPMQGLQLGMQGAGMLSGQQALMNPLGWMGTGIQGLNSLQQRDLFKTLAGAAGQALGGRSIGSLSAGNAGAGGGGGGGGTVGSAGDLYEYGM